MRNRKERERVPELRTRNGSPTRPLTLVDGPWHVVSGLEEGSARQLLSGVASGRIVREQVFRDNWRTLSAQVRFQNTPLLLKVPRARNRRLWERLLTLFRGSDALRIFHHLALMSSLGLSAPEPVMAGEKRKAGFVTDAFVCYRYVEGRRAEPRDADRVLDKLRQLHRLGYLRTDAQLANFLIRGDDVVFIDFRLKRPRFLPGLQKARELDRFLRSCPEATRFLTADEASSLWLKLAHVLEEASFARRDFKRRLRGRKKSGGAGAPRG